MLDYVGGTVVAYAAAVLKEVSGSTSGSHLIFVSPVTICFGI